MSKKPGESMSRIIAFDVNETLLDLAALDPLFEDIFGAASVRREWFSQVLQSAMVTTIFGQYQDFGTIAGHALSQMGERHGVRLTQKNRDAVSGGLRSLPPHSDVQPALRRLADSGMRLIALTNSPPQVARAQLENAELAGFFEDIFSVDAAQTLKPAPEVYNTAARSLLASAQEMRLVAAHAWDVAGAMNAGWHGAFVARPGQVLDPLFPAPDIVGSDLGEVADQILVKDTGGGDEA